MSIILASLVVAAVAAFFWNQIAGFLVNKFLPFIRENVSSIFHAMAAFVDFVNKGMVAARNVIKSGYQWIMKNLLRCSTVYTMEENGQVTATTVTIINDNGKLAGTETREVYDKWDIPADVLVELTRNAQSAQLDNKHEIQNRAQQQAQKQALSLADAMA